MARLLLLALVLPAASQKVSWVQTARFKDETVDLLQEMPPLEMEAMPEAPEEKAIVVDTTQTYQEILGFGGAFTEASAINWRKLSAADQAKVIQLYFAPPEEGGLGYTLGRVPINSCDFSPASYNFDPLPDDVDLAHFDHTVAHDVDVGMIPMIQQAQDAVRARGFELNVYASPWSPPAWMKAPAWEQQSMLLSASPNGLLPEMQRPWANYFSRFISAYKKHGIKLWGVTVQNEPEASVGWEACLWTPEYMAGFVRDHLGPVLEADHPGVKIVGFDHNKDHVDVWAKTLYNDSEAAKYLYGVGVHWYGGLNSHNLEYTHNLDPSKAILATEACNCGGVVYRNATFAAGNITKDNFLAAWWSRAEALGLDILVDLQFWAVGWTDWNLVLDTSGGPNHLKNLCDANIIVDAKGEIGDEILIKQASYYYMGHFSRYLPPGSKRIGMYNGVEPETPQLVAGDVKNGQALLFAPCDGNDAQKWQLDGDSLIIRGTNDAESSDGFEHGGMCMDAVVGGWVPGKLQVAQCTPRKPAEVAAAEFKVLPVAGGSQIVHTATGTCVTTTPANGGAVGLDPGVKIVAAQLHECLAKGTPSQTFTLANYDAQGFPANFPIRTLSSAPGGGELCLQPQIARTPHFSAVAFETPTGEISLVVMNVGDNTVNFTLVDKAAQTGLRHLTMPSHTIRTYRWTSAGKGGKGPATMEAVLEAPIVAKRTAPAGAPAAKVVAPTATWATMRTSAREIPTSARQIPLAEAVESRPVGEAAPKAAEAAPKPAEADKPAGWMPEVMSALGLCAVVAVLAAAMLRCTVSIGGGRAPATGAWGGGWHEVPAETTSDYAEFRTAR